MGFRLNRTYRLDFSDFPDLEGLEVLCRSATVQTVAEFRNADEEEIAALLAANVIDWNYEDEDGNTLPIEAASFLGLERVVIRAIAREWYKAATGVSSPLAERSASPERFPEESIPTAPL
jgi:hypothetical protein